MDWCSLWKKGGFDGFGDKTGPLVHAAWKVWPKHWSRLSCLRMVQTIVSTKLRHLKVWSPKLSYIFAYTQMVQELAKQESRPQSHRLDYSWLAVLVYRVLSWMELDELLRQSRREDVGTWKIYSWLIGESNPQELHYQYDDLIFNCLVVWNMAFMTFHSVGNFIIPTVTHSIIFQRVWNHQAARIVGT